MKTKNYLHHHRQHDKEKERVLTVYDVYYWSPLHRAPISSHVQTYLCYLHSFFENIHVTIER